MSGYTIQGARGLYLSQFSQSSNGGPSGDLGRVVLGINETAGLGGSGLLTPYRTFPATSRALTEDFEVNFDDTSLVSNGSTTDGNSRWFQGNKTAFGSAVLTSTRAGYQGKVLSTTGSSSGSANSFIATDGYLNVSNQIACMVGTFYVPDPNVGAHSFVMGFANKNVDPNPASIAWTDGFYIYGTTSGGIMTIYGNSIGNSVANTATAALATIPAGTAKSIQLAVETFGNNVYFWTRDPSSASNKWSYVTQTLTNVPRSTIILRPHFVHYTNYAGTIAYNMLSPKYWFEKTIGAF